jgi:16S rRNA (adenine1518-N6/adenine1519-N6)-dimethyltransferase
MTPQRRSDVTRLLDRHGLRPRKALGQHFLADPNITRKIVESAGIEPGDRVVEIGAGTGTLTVGLAEAGARVVAFEVDEHLRPVLEEVTGPWPQVTLRFEDATRVDLTAVLDGGPWRLVANLPYNVGTPILLEALRHVPAIDRFVIMVQREVADRLVAVPGDAAYGLPSVVVRLHGEPARLFTVPPQVFVPPPSVGSAVVRIDRVPAPPHAERAVALAAAAFGMRRKMLRGSLASLLADPVAVLAAGGVDPTLRAEELSAEDYLRLAEVAP